jgi:hypothetical protein
VTAGPESSPSDDAAESQANQAVGSRRHRWPSRRKNRGPDKLGVEIRAYLDLTQDIHDMRPDGTEEDWINPAHSDPVDPDKA